jgi:hypothetical protein
MREDCTFLFFVFIKRGLQRKNKEGPRTLKKKKKKKKKANDTFPLYFKFKLTHKTHAYLNGRQLHSTI